MVVRMIGVDSVIADDIISFLNSFDIPVNNTITEGNLVNIRINKAHLLELVIKGDEYAQRLEIHLRNHNGSFDVSFNEFVRLEVI